MITLRTFTAPVDAQLAKTLLGDHGIDSVVADENSSLYSAPLAVGIRLMVPEEDVERAGAILDALDFRPATAPDLPARRNSASSHREIAKWLLLAACMLAVILCVFFYAARNTRQAAAPGYTWSDMRYYADRMDYDSAIAITKILIKRNANDDYAYSSLGRLYFLKGQLALSEAAYLRAYELWPSPQHAGDLDAIRARADHPVAPAAQDTPASR